MPSREKSKRRWQINRLIHKGGGENMTKTINNRYEFVLLFDVKNGNPNGDPDAGNLPRIDPETGHGITTDVCLKRKIRNYVELVKNNEPPYEIHVREGAFLSEHHKRAHLAIENETVELAVPNDLIEEFKVFSNYPNGILFDFNRDKPVLILKLSDLEEAKKQADKIKMKKKDKDAENQKMLSPAAKSVLLELFVDSKEKRAAKWMCKNFFDVRTFGAVMSTGDMRCGQIRGPVQLSFAKSIEPIVSLDISMSRTAAVSVKNTDKGLGARKSIVPYGLYRVHGYISAPLAEQTGFSEEDLELLWDALMTMFDHDRSAARGEMASRKLFVFKHDSKLGNAPANKLFDLIEVKRKDESRPARSFEDYEIIVDRENVPEGVTLEEKL